MPRIAVVVKGYPRLSETFIAQEILGLERRGFEILIVSLRQPTDPAVNDINRAIRAEVLYLPEYLKDDPPRVRAARRHARDLPGYAEAEAQYREDLGRDPSPSRHRRWGQAQVLARELPDDVKWLHVHYLHTPASVVRYTAMLLQRDWSFSAHAKDIWTTPDWELGEKLRDAAWGVTCTSVNHAHLRSLANGHGGHVHLQYHGLDPARVPATPRAARATADPLRILGVGRAVEKKGFDDLLRALSRLDADLDWRFEHIGGGPLVGRLKAQAERLGLSDRVTWHGARDQAEVFAAYARADLFVLPCRVARNGDRDGLPNVLMEAQSACVACVSTAISAVPELIVDGATGLLVPERSPAELAAAIDRLLRDGAMRARMAEAGRERVLSRFSAEAGFDSIARMLGQSCEVA